jgi:hypothetical protein
MVAATLRQYAGRLRVRDVDLAAFIVVRLMLGVAHAAVVDHPERSRDPRLADELADVVLRYLAA